MFQEQRCIITGGSRGLGFAIAKALAERGAKVAFTFSKNQADAADAKQKLESLGAQVLSFQGSVADLAHTQQVVSAVVAAWGGVDVLVNNAGITQVLPMALIEESDWDRMMDVNVKGAFLFSRAALKPMIRAKYGRILNIGSFASERVIESPVHYAAAKSALRGFTEALAREMGRYNINVNLLSPGLLEVGLSTALPKYRVQEYLSQCPAGRLASLEEVAEAALFLLSRENSFMTGAKLAIDGGL